MNLGRAVALTPVLLFCVLAMAQEELLERHQAIDSLYRTERYAELVRTIDRQVEQAAGTTWDDSLYLYTYQYGRAVRQLGGAEACAAAVERFYAMIQQRDPDPLHRISALDDLSWTYYDLGLMRECFRVDSLAMVAASANGVPGNHLGLALQHMAFDMAMIGDHRKAGELYGRAGQVYRSLDDGPYTMDIAECLNGMGSSKWNTGRIREAEAHFSEALELLEQDSSMTAYSRRAGILGNLALVWEDAGDLVRSKQYTRDAMAMHTVVIEGTDDVQLRDQSIMHRSRGYNNLAALYHSLGDHGTSRRFLDRCKEDRLRILEPDDPYLVQVEERYADLALAEGRPELADSLMRAVLRNERTRNGAGTEKEAVAIRKLALAAAQMGQHDRADSLFRSSIAIQRRLGDTEHSTWLAAALRDQAEHALTRGALTKAHKALVESRSIYRVVYGAQDHRTLQCELDLADLYLEQGHLDSADRWSGRVLEALRDRVPDPEKADLPTTDPAPHLLPRTLLTRVRIARVMGTDGRQQLQDLELAVKALARDRKALLDEGSRLLLIGAQKEVFDLAQLVAFELYEGTGEERWLDKLLGLSEANKAVLLRSRLNDFSAMAFSGVPDSLLAMEQELLLGLSAERSEDLAGLVEREQAFRSFLTRLQGSYPDYFALKYGDERITLAEVQEQLIRPGQQLLSYSFVDSVLLVMLIGREEARAWQLPAQNVADQVMELEQAIQLRDGIRVKDLARSLHQALLWPLSASLVEEELLIVPDEALYHLNFEVLMPKVEVNGNSRFLIEDHVVSYLLSVSSALRFQQLSARGGKGILAIAPGFDDAMKQAYVSSFSDSNDADPAMVRAVQQPFTVQMVQRMSARYAAASMLGHEATEKNFRDRAAEHGIIHLGTHAEWNNKAPLYSRLFFSPLNGSGNDADDGYLHAYELYELELNAELAVLSACETGAGDERGPEGVQSLAYGFAFAGCPSLITTLWPVDEQVSNALLARFYRYLGEGMPKNRALRQAKLDHLKEAADELRAPFYWAGLVLTGDTSPVELDRSWPWWAWLACAAFLFVVLVLVRRVTARP
ncbi:MAG: CHAT domain-containing protein [Flavobacteriales bacterium]|nr:CHAT domain-containing protein [Flavobacteriales bacterium]